MWFVPLLAVWAVGAYLDIVRKVKCPPLYFTMGAISMAISEALRLKGL